MIVFEQRAATILFNLLAGISKPVLIPANVCPIVPLVFFKATKPFEVVDISDETLCIDEGIVIERLRKQPDKYGGVLFVRTYGVQRSFERFFTSIKDINDKLLVIDDACLCPPKFGMSEESAASVVLYSTGYGKCIDVGVGGFAHCKPDIKYVRGETSFRVDHLVTITEQYKSALRQKERFQYRDCDWLNSAATTSSFEDYRNEVERRIPTVQKHKQYLNDIYQGCLPLSIQLSPDYQGWRFNVLVPNKEALLIKIFGAGLFASSHYDSVTGIFSAGQSSKSDRLASQIVNLFNDLNFDVEKAIRVTEIVNEHVASAELIGH